MANVQLLNNQTHSDVRIDTQIVSQAAIAFGSVMIVPAEISSAMRDYPLFFRKNKETNTFYLCALLGLVPDSNLFAQADLWNGAYTPHIVEKGPFMIGADEINKSAELMIYLDTDAPSVGSEQGEALFENGEVTDFVKHISHLLMTIHDGVKHTDAFAQALQAHDLMEPVNIDIELDNGEKLAIAGIYSVNDEKLNALSGDALTELAKPGYLQKAYLIIESMSNVKRMIDIKNQIA